MEMVILDKETNFIQDRANHLCLARNQLHHLRTSDALPWRPCAPDDCR